MGKIAISNEELNEIESGIPVIDLSEIGRVSRQECLVGYNYEVHCHVEAVTVEQKKLLDGSAFINAHVISINNIVVFLKSNGQAVELNRLQEESLSDRMKVRAEDAAFFTFMAKQPLPPVSPSGRELCQQCGHNYTVHEKCMDCQE